LVKSYSSAQDFALAANYGFISYVKQYYGKNCYTINLYCKEERSML